MNSKNTLQHILSLILISCVIINSCNNPKLTGDEDVINVEPSNGSGPITKGHSDSLRANYVKDGKHLKTIDSAVNEHKKIPLEGFVFDADQIRQIVDTNKSGQKPDQVVIYFGLVSKKRFVGKNRNWHVIMMGRYKGKLLDYNKADIAPASPGMPPPPPDLKAVSIFDKADPCPPCKVKNIVVAKDTIK